MDVRAPRTSSSPIVGLLVVLAVATILSGCSSSAAPSAASAGEGLPKATVTDVASGAPVDLQSFRPADKPLLVWFWAPF
jgi:hypothetical protein